MSKSSSEKRPKIIPEADLKTIKCAAATSACFSANQKTFSSDCREKNCDCFSPEEETEKLRHLEVWSSSFPLKASFTVLLIPTLALLL